MADQSMTITFMPVQVVKGRGRWAETVFKSTPITITVTHKTCRIVMPTKAAAITQKNELSPLGSGLTAR